MAKKSFEEWLGDVNVAVIRRVGLSVHDLPDVPLRDWYEDGYSASSAAAAAIEEAGDA